MITIAMQGCSAAAMRYTDETQLNADAAVADNEAAACKASIYVCGDSGPYPSLRFRRPRNPEYPPGDLLPLLAFLDGALSKPNRAARQRIVEQAARALEPEQSKHWDDARPRYWTERHGYQVMLRPRGTIAARRISEGYWPMESWAWTPPNPRLLAHPVWRITRSGQVDYAHDGQF